MQTPGLSRSLDSFRILSVFFQARATVQYCFRLHWSFASLSPVAVSSKLWARERAMAMAIMWMKAGYTEHPHGRISIIFFTSCFILSLDRVQMPRTLCIHVAMNDDTVMLCACVPPQSAAFSPMSWYIWIYMDLESHMLAQIYHLAVILFDVHHSELGDR